MPVTFVPLNRTGWTAYATSFFDIPYAPIKMIDGDVNTACVTPTTFSFPWEIWFDMGAKQQFNTISFQRRQDGPQDSPGAVTISTSDDGITWAPVTSATWTNVGTAIIQQLPSSFAQWIKVSMLGIAVGARGALSCAEFNVGFAIDQSGGMTVACSCPAHPAIAGCLLTSLTFHCELSFTSVKGIGMHAFAQLIGGPVGVGIGLTSSDTIIDIQLAPLQGFVDAWGALQIHFGGEESLFQPPVDGGAAIASASWYINQHYTCIDTSGASPVITSQVIYSTNLFGGGNSCIENDIVKVTTSVGIGGGVSALTTSSGLGTCDGGGGGDGFGGFFSPPPRPNGNLLDQSGAAGQVCLCVTGGTPPYKYQIASGLLPCGQTLNKDTGCIEGTADGSCSGTDDVTFLVTDSRSNQATVDCGFIRPCNGGGGGGAAAFGNAFY